MYLEKTQSNRRKLVFAFHNTGSDVFPYYLISLKLGLHLHPLLFSPEIRKANCTVSISACHKDWNLLYKFIVN